MCAHWSHSSSCIPSLWSAPARLFRHTRRWHAIARRVTAIVPGHRQYTCYGCHEHSLSNITRKHVEEGIRNFANCVRCHRDARGEGGERGEGHERGASLSPIRPPLNTGKGVLSALSIAHILSYRSTP